MIVAGSISSSIFNFYIPSTGYYRVRYTHLYDNIESDTIKGFYMRDVTWIANCIVRSVMHKGFNLRTSSTDHRHTMSMRGIVLL